MLTFIADARDGNVSGAVSCASCCCESIVMRAGEVNLVAIDYGAWSAAFGAPGVVPVMDYSSEAEPDTCSTATVGGFVPPSNDNYQFITAVNTTVAIDITANALPAGNTFAYEVITLRGPHYGVLTQTGTGTYSYVPASGFEGYDFFVYKMTDAQGRTVVRTVRIQVGTPTSNAQDELLSLVPYIDLTKVKVDQQFQRVTFPLRMPINAQECEVYKLTIRQPARDCSGTQFDHFMCFTITAKDCL